MLYAGIALISFKYFIINDIVKKLKQWSKSAGNSFIYYKLLSINKIGTSETLRNEIGKNTENVKPISVHRMINGVIMWVRAKFRGHLKVLITKVLKETLELASLMIKGMVISLEIDLFLKKIGNRGSKLDWVWKRATSIWFFSLSKECCKMYSSRRETGYWEKILSVIFWVYTLLVVHISIFISFSLRLGLRELSLNNFSKLYKNFYMIPSRRNYCVDLDSFKNPYYVTGFADGEASFGIYFTKYSKSKAGYLIQPNFQITLHKNDSALLLLLKKFFKGVGGIYKDGDRLLKYSVRSLKDVKVIIEHFEKYPLQTQKRADFELFKQIVQLLLDKKHLTKEGLLKIISLKAAMNKGISSSLQATFPDLVYSPRPLVENPKIEDPNWLSGFADAEGCFLVDVQESAGHKLKERVRLRFTITQHARDSYLLELLVAYLGCGKIISNAVASRLLKIL